jgi:hypothetical protein
MGTKMLWIIEVVKEPSTCGKAAPIIGGRGWLNKSGSLSDKAK